MSLHQTNRCRPPDYTNCRACCLGNCARLEVTNRAPLDLRYGVYKKQEVAHDDQANAPGFVAAREMLLPSEAAAIEAQFKELPPAPWFSPEARQRLEEVEASSRQPTPGETTTEAPGASPPGARSDA